MLELPAPIARFIDRAVIRMARVRLETRVGEAGRPAEAVVPVPPPDFFNGAIAPAEHMVFSGRHEFSCDSPIEGVAQESSRIFGEFHHCGEGWRNRPVIVMLHGWNGENCYRLLFPLLARRFRPQGISLLSFELPCHGRRRAPRAPGNDFISPDLSAMIRSTHQALADARALIGWLRQEGCGTIGIWGISLGGWLAGLLACHDNRLSCAVLMTPIVRMDRAIQELEFCAPVRRSLAGRAIPAFLNLTAHRPLLDRQNLLLVAGRHDLFAPPARVEELREAWNYPPIARYGHGHITMLFSVRAMTRASGFIKDRVATR